MKKKTRAARATASERTGLRDPIMCDQSAVLLRVYRKVLGWQRRKVAILQA